MLKHVKVVCGIKKKKVALMGSIDVRNGLCNLIGGSTSKQGSKCMCSLRASALSFPYKN